MIRKNTLWHTSALSVVSFVFVVVIAGMMGVFGMAGMAASVLRPTPASAQADACTQFQCSSSTQDEDTYLSCVKDKQNCLQGKINEAKESQNTLSKTINIISNQIAIQELQIEQTQTEISQLKRQILELTDRIMGLNVSLDNLSAVLVTRVGEHYKRQTINPLLILLTRHSISEALSDYKYLKEAQEQTARAMQLAESQRISYDEQKVLLEKTQAELAKKQATLEGQQKELDRQRAEQQFLLKETKQNEARFQQELAKTIAELQAIQSIIAGRGAESKVGPVSAGATIATVIEGASACSTGSHLHFEVVKDGTNRDPAGYLKSIDSINWVNSPDSAFSFSGSWEWPIQDPAKITQGYGMTYYARVRRAYGGAPHTGIDMFSRGYNFNVRAVADGTLSRGSIPCGGGILRYVKLEHNSDGIATYYLHVNY